MEVIGGSSMFVVMNGSCKYGGKDLQLTQPMLEGRRTHRKWLAAAVAFTSQPKSVWDKASREDRPLHVVASCCQGMQRCAWVSWPSAPPTVSEASASSPRSDLLASLYFSISKIVFINFLSLSLSFILSVMSPFFLPTQLAVKREFFLAAVLTQGFRLWVYASVKHLETFIVKGAMQIKLNWLELNYNVRKLPKLS